MSNIFDRKTINEVCPDLATNGNFFRYIGNYNNISATTLALMYSARSGDKKVSSLIDMYITTNNETLTQAQQEEIANCLKAIYQDKWTKSLAALTAQYTLLQNINTTEEIDSTGSNDSTKSNTYGAKTQTNQYGAKTDTFDKGNETTQNAYGATSGSTQYGGSTDSVQYGATSTSTNNYVNGFNAGNVADTNSTTTGTTHTDTTTKGQHTDSTSAAAHTDTTTVSSQTDTTVSGQHTDTLTTNSVTDSESVEQDSSSNSTKTLQGLQGSAQDEINKELELRRFNFIEMMLRDIDKYLTIKVY